MFALYLLLGLLALVAAVALFVIRYRVSGSYFDSAGVPIFYTDQGAGIPIVLIHGFGVQGDLNWRWAGCVRALTQRGFRVIVMDARGHGRSGKPHAPEAYGAEMADDVVRLLDHLGIQKAHVAGYSMGGFITLKTIIRHPDRLLSGVICAAGWGVIDEHYRALFSEIVDAIEQRRVFDPITHWLEPGKKAARAQCAAANFFMRSTNDLPAIVNVFKTFEDLSVDEAELRENAVPTMTLVGTHDGIREASDRLPGVMANHTLVYVPRGNHITTIMHPNFMREMLHFLRANSPQVAETATA